MHYAMSWALSPSGEYVAYQRLVPEGVFVAQTTVQTPTPQTDWRVSNEGAAFTQGSGDNEPPVWSSDSLAPINTFPANVRKRLLT